MDLRQIVIFQYVEERNGPRLGKKQNEWMNEWTNEWHPSEKVIFQAEGERYGFGIDLVKNRMNKWMDEWKNERRTHLRKCNYTTSVGDRV